METKWFVFLLGLIAQGLFSARILVQWYKSEKSRKLESPLSYWILSLAGSMVFFAYGWFRDDFSILFGQFITYAIYIWNINAKGVWKHFPLLARAFIIVFPFLVLATMLSDAPAFFQSFLKNDSIPMWLVLLGTAGQTIFTLRFIYQWIYSVRRNESMMPVGFWLISLIGSGTIICYAVLRRDPILILGHLFGFVAYARNMMIGIKASRNR